MDFELNIHEPGCRVSVLADNPYRAYQLARKLLTATEALTGGLCSVTLIKYNSDKISTIKVVRDNPKVTVGLKEAKVLVESCPCVVLEGVTRDKAEEFADRLRALGDDVRID